MANPVKGEVEFVVAGARYVFVWGMLAIATLERTSGKTSLQFFRRPEGEWGASDTLYVFHAGLYRHHRLSEERVADLLDTMSGDQVQQVIADGFGLSKSREDANATASPPLPPASAAGTTS